MENIEAIKTKAEQITAELAANDAANAAEHAAAAALLTRVIEVSKKGAHAAGDKIAIEWTKGNKPDRFFPTRVIGLDGKIGPTQSRNDGSNCGTIYGSDTVLTIDGLKRFTYEGTWSSRNNSSELLMVAEVSDVNLSSESLENIERYTTRICDAITSAGSRADATKAALARAEKMKAISALL